MLDIKRIRNNKNEVEALLNTRLCNISLDRVSDMDVLRRKKLTEVESMKYLQKKMSKDLSLLNQNSKDISSIRENLKIISENIKKIDTEIKEIDIIIFNELLKIPNTPHIDISTFSNECINKEIRVWGTTPCFDFSFKPHWELGLDLDILDFDRALKISGPRFTLFKDLGAKLHRALYLYMLDMHTTDHGFTEIIPPSIVNEKSMFSTGQLPKFEDDMFKLNKKDYYLIPTAEVPLTNIYRNEILEMHSLPEYLTAYTSCFRAESSSSGRDTRGLIRNHEFGKVEMVIFSDEKDSYNELEKLTNFAENILKSLNLPYRVIELCPQDLGFSSSKTYDLEVWMPSYNKYVEISSCSNFEDFQARRANIRYRDSNGKLKFVHTLNGSGLAIGRTFAAILENYQNCDGSVSIPNPLIKYMNGITKIKK